MKIVLKPSLEHIALIKVVVLLWNQNDIRAFVTKLCYVDLYPSEKWETITAKVIKKVSHLSLPHLLKEMVLGVIKPIGEEISMWVKYNNRYFHVNLPYEFCWTPQGTIDRKRTAEVLVRDESFDMDMPTRYRLACIYCLEDDIIRCWNRLPKDLKKSGFYEFPIIFWSRIMRRRGNPIDYKEEFCMAVRCANRVAAEYFLQKLTPQEREESFGKIANYVENNDVLCFLISQMNEEQQVKFFRHRPYRMLLYFLKWPWHNFFIEIASCMWDLLSRNNFDDIFMCIILKVKDGYKDCNYQRLFSKFWQESPNALKSLFIEEIDKSHVLTFLFYIKDKENIRLILKDAILLVKEKNIYSDKLMKTLCECLCENEWDFLKSCIQECFPSENEMLKFKEELEKRLICPYFKKHFLRKKQSRYGLF